MSLSIRLEQLRVHQGAVEENIKHAELRAETAAAAGADLVVLPQYALTGYPSKRVLGTLAGRGSELAGQLSRIAAENRVTLAASLPMSEDGITYVDSILVHGPEGQLLLKYQRASKFWREDGCLTGDWSGCPIEVGGATLGFLAGDDIYFPELTRSLAAAGASAVICLTYNAAHRLGNAFSTSDVLPSLVMAHAVTCGVDFLLCGATGTVDSDDGQSIIAGAQLIPSTCALSISEGRFVACEDSLGLTVSVDDNNLDFFRLICRRVTSTPHAEVV